MTQAGKKLYLVANWKSHKTETETRDWLDAMSEMVVPEGIEVIVCPPYPFLPVAAKSTGWPLGAQDISPFPMGAYTGAVAADMIRPYVTYAIVGHSERRRYFHETNQDVANKVGLLADAGIVPIVCVDEPYLVSQIEGLEKPDFERMIFAYEPLTAIGSGHPDTPEHADSVAQRVKAATHSDVPVLYGGSVNPANIKSFTEMGAISGALVGGASLDPEEWKRLIDATA